MDKFLNKIKRAFRNFNVASFGAIATGFAVIITLLELATYANSGASLGDNLLELFFAAINCLFYLSLTKNFITAKQTNNFGPVRYNMLVITIFEYVIPTINLFLVTLIFGGLQIALVSTLLSNSILGVLYFVFLARQGRNIGKRNNLYLKIFGALIFLIDAAIAGIYCFYGIEILLSEQLGVYEILSGITYIFESIKTIFLGLLFFTFPFALKKEGY